MKNMSNFAMHEYFPRKNSYIEYIRDQYFIECRDTTCIPCGQCRLSIFFLDSETMRQVLASCRIIL